MCDYSIDFIVVRRAVFNNFLRHDAPFNEKDLTPIHVVRLIEEVGRSHYDLGKAGVTLDTLEILSSEEGAAKSLRGDASNG